MPLKQYDPEKVIITAGLPGAGFTVRDWVSATFAPSVDKRSLSISTTGGGRHIKSADQSGVLTIVLKDFSITNTTFEALDAAEQPFPISMIDKTSNGKVFFSDDTMVRRDPDLDFQADPTDVTWTLQCVKATAVQAGAAEV